MKREFIGELLQTIYCDISIRDNSIVYSNHTGSDEILLKPFAANENNLENILQYLEKKIHPRYTKVVLDINPQTYRIVEKWIDDRYNKHTPRTVIEKREFINGIPTIRNIIIPETMIELVQVIKYHPKRIDTDIESYFKNQKIPVTKGAYETLINK